MFVISTHNSGQGADGLRCAAISSACMCACASVCIIHEWVWRSSDTPFVLGSGRNTLHLALWGTVDTNSNTLAMTVGLPATTLAKAGLRGLPPEYLLPVAVSGPLHRPSVEWNAAGVLVVFLVVLWPAHTCGTQ